MFQDAMPGGGFLVADVPIGRMFTREGFNETQREFADTARKFIVNDVLSKVDQIEEKAKRTASRSSSVS